jgi:hypothetical protein
MKPFAAVAALPRAAKAQLIAIAVLGLALAVLIWFAFQTHAALCAFRGDLNGRANELAIYIDHVKQGRREILQGFTVAELERTLTNQRATLASLGSLRCGADL